MREFLISLILHLIILFFISSNFNKPKEKIKETFLTINLASSEFTFSEETLSSQENLVSEIDNPPIEKKIDNFSKKEFIEVKKEIIDKKISPKKDSPKKIEKNIVSDLTEEPLSPGTNYSAVDSENFIEGSSGEKIAVNQNIQGLSYKILNSPTPNYPSQARKIRISQDVVIKTKFLVGLNGKIESIEILEGIENYGFRNEVSRTLKHWQFSPIEYKGEKIKIYFYKDFIFNLNNK